MNKLLSLFSILLLNISCNSQTEFNKDALSYEMIAIDNSKISFQDILKKHHGKTIVIEVWASWCSDCIKNMNKIKELQTNNPDLVYIFLSVDKTAEAWINGIKKHEINGENYLIEDGMKGKFGKAIKIDWIPRYLIIDKTGKIVLFRAIETDFDKINETIKSIQ